MYMRIYEVENITIDLEKLIFVSETQVRFKYHDSEVYYGLNLKFDEDVTLDITGNSFDADFETETVKFGPFGWFEKEKKTMIVDPNHYSETEQFKKMDEYRLNIVKAWKEYKDNNET